MTIAFELDQTALEEIAARQSAAGLPLPADVPSGLTGVLKRSLDLFLAIAALIFLAPLFLVIALMIKLSDGGPIFYRHTRCGRGGLPFACYKFRTMRVNADEHLRDVLKNDAGLAEEWAHHQKLKKDPRITKFGLFLRKTSLDELPQIFNILLGDMSVIGPRPVTFEELPRYGRSLIYYSAARPGITGLWQVSGRNDTTYEERIAFDTQYVKQWSMKKDISILLRTVPVVLLAKGAY
jgi:exopolysaccharide production protein ExoY